ncbi:hypothetical protein KC316_g9883, partial [Hortaea werneckii]
VIEPPLPLVRLRVEYTAPEGGNFDIDNPQRFSSRFLGRVANATDVVQFHRKRQTQKQIKARPEMPDADRLEQIRLDSVKVEKLVQEFLTAQSLTILPQNNFSDAVGMFVDKDDKNAMHDFVDDALASQVKQLIGDEEDEDWDEERMAEMMEECKAALEAKFDRGEAKRSKRTISRNPKPDNWDSDVDGPWEDQPASYIGQGEQEGEIEVNDDDDENASRASTRGRGRGRGRGGRAAGAGTTRKTAAATKKAPAKAGGRGKKKQAEDEEDEEEDVVMIDDDDDDDDESQLFVKPTPKKAPAKKAPTKSNASTSKASTGKQTQLSWLGSQSSQANGSATNGSGRAAANRAPPKRRQEPSEDEISDDDAFEPPPTAASRSRTSRR